MLELTNRSKGWLWLNVIKPKTLTRIIIEKLNEIFVTDGLTNNDLVNYAYTISGKMSENTVVMNQVANNSPEQAMLGDFQKAVDDAIMDSGQAHENQMMQLLSNPDRAVAFSKLIFELLKSGRSQ